MFRKICLGLLFIISTSVSAMEEDAASHACLSSPEFQLAAHPYPPLRAVELLSPQSVSAFSSNHSTFIIPYTGKVEWEKFIYSSSESYSNFYKGWFKENTTSRLYTKKKNGDAPSNKSISPLELENLPSEILINILGYFSLKELGIIRQLNHYFDALSQDKWVWKQHIALTPKGYNSFYEEWFEEKLDSTPALTIKKHKIEVIKNTSYTWQTGPLLQQSLEEVIPPFILVPLVAKLAYDKSSKEMLRTIAIHEPRLFITKESIKTLFAIILHADKFFVPSMPLSDQQFLLHKLAPLDSDHICRLARLIPQNKGIFFRKNKSDESLQSDDKKGLWFCKIHDRLHHTGLVHITIMLSQAQQFFIPGLKEEQRQELFNILAPLSVNQLIDMVAETDKIFIPQQEGSRQKIVLKALKPFIREDQIRCSCRSQ